MNTKIVIEVVKDWLWKLAVAIITILILNLIFGDSLGILNELASKIGLAWAIIYPILLASLNLFKEWRTSKDKFKPFLFANYDSYFTEVADKMLELLVMVLAIVIGYLMFSHNMAIIEGIGGVFSLTLFVTAGAIALKVTGIINQIRPK